MKTHHLFYKKNRRQSQNKLWYLAVILASTLTVVFFLSIFAYPTCAEEISIGNAVKKFVESNKRVRIAVFDFANTDGTKTRYDMFIADTVVTELSKYPVTLLERKKLEMLLGEQALSQTGVVDSNKALKLGTLLPVDVVVSGSYTEIGNKLIINGRFIHVGTGEILSAFASSMEGVADRGAKVQTPEDREAICKKKQDIVKKALYDLKDRSAVEKAVDIVVTIPFDNDCGKVHYDVMYTFSRYKIADSRYRAFLMKTLTDIDTPSDDNRTSEIIRYFASDGTIDREEWSAGIAALKKMRGSSLYLVLRPLLNAGRETGTTVTARVNEIMRLTAAGEVGRPVPIDSLTMFYAVMNGLELRSDKADIATAITVFRTHKDLIPDDDTNNKKAAEILRALYSAESVQGASRSGLSLLVTYLKSRTPSAPLGESTADLIKSLESKQEERRPEDKGKRETYQKDLEYLRTNLAELYCYSIGTARKQGYRYVVEERSLFVLKNGMQCEYVPGIKDLENDMRSGDWDRKLKAAETLSKIGDAAKPAEKTVIKYLGQQGFGYQGGTLRKFCAITLGNIKTTDPEGISLLISAFPDYDHGVSYEAEAAIKKIGAPAIPFLIRGLGSKEHATRLRCAKALGEQGAKAKQALPQLQQMTEKDEDPYVRVEAKGAVQMIKNDF
jgi:TolB-like protein